MKYFVKSFGCRLNQYYVDYFCNAVLKSGQELASNSSNADVVAIASCIVTHRAERDTRRYISQVRRLNPSAKIAVFGCYPMLRAMDGVFYAGNLKGLIKELDLVDPGILDKPFMRIRVNIKIQEGCNFRCSYCVVPQVRGSSQSREMQDIIREVENLWSNGVMEIVLTGIQTGEWGREWGMRLSDLIYRLHDCFSGLRIRLSSISPIHITREIVELMKSGVVLPHLHLPLQHGSGRILKLMKRPYKLEYYVELIEMLYTEVNNLAIGSDIIVGYPEETEMDFEESFKLIESLPFAYLHIFEFSPRPGTQASSLKPLPSFLVKRRKEKLLQLAREKKEAYLESYIGKEVRGVVESHESGFFRITTDNYMKLLIPENQHLQIGKVHRFYTIERMDLALLAKPLF
ncbi:MAG TPA: MiaB/RimO family radical SAM methylthiotransferase [Candidatus Hydrothermia bacterium]|nr:MiaB/RimO family radical SAM methylthiotransferase [Candidatus Hydrothermia bacterium]